MSRTVGESVGLAGIGCYIPEGTISSAEIARRADLPLELLTGSLGMRQKPVAGPSEQPSQMALAAGRAALSDARLDPAELDLIIFAGSAPQDYLLWSAAGKLQHTLGAVKAFAFELTNGCNGLSLGTQVARQLLLGSPTMQHALVVTADVYSKFLDYSRPGDHSLFHLADAAGAVVLRRNEPSNRILSYVQITDGSFADYVKVEVGGTARPCSPETARQTVSVEQPRKLAELLSAVYVRNYVSVIREALAECGRSADEIDFLFINQVRALTVSAVLDILKVPASHSLASLEDHGHMPAVDTIFGLSRFLAEGRIQPGSLVVLASSAVGFSWAATVLQY